jgi:hypothetical protein
LAFAPLPLSLAGFIVSTMNDHPYGPPVFAALALGFLGRVVFPESSIRVSLGAALAAPIVAWLQYLPMRPPIALLLLVPFLIPPAGVGVALASAARDAWRPKEASL